MVKHVPESQPAREDKHDEEVEDLYIMISELEKPWEAEGEGSTTDIYVSARPPSSQVSASQPFLREGPSVSSTRNRPSRATKDDRTPTPQEYSRQNAASTRRGDPGEGSSRHVYAPDYETRRPVVSRTTAGPSATHQPPRLRRETRKISSDNTSRPDPYSNQRQVIDNNNPPPSDREFRRLVISNIAARPSTTHQSRPRTTPVSDNASRPNPYSINRGPLAKSSQQASRETHDQTQDNEFEMYNWPERYNWSIVIACGDRSFKSFVENRLVEAPELGKHALKYKKYRPLRREKRMLVLINLREYVDLGKVRLIEHRLATFPRLSQRRGYLDSRTTKDWVQEVITVLYKDVLLRMAKREYMPESVFSEAASKAEWFHRLMDRDDRPEFGASKKARLRAAQFWPQQRIPAYIMGLASWENGRMSPLPSKRDKDEDPDDMDADLMCGPRQKGGLIARHRGKNTSSTSSRRRKSKYVAR